MENQAAGKFMGHRECEWVRARLPLYVGDAAGEQTEAGGDGGDLAPNDYWAIKRHLSCCRACVGHETEIKRAQAVLLAAAEQMPFELEAPSLWPVLERRIANRNARKGSRWIRAAHGATDRWTPGTILDRERPLRLAWTRDLLLETLRRRRSRFGSQQSPGLVLRTCAAAAMVVVLVGIPIVRRQWAAESTIASNAAPLAIPAAMAEPADLPQPVSDPEDDADVAARQMAEAEPLRPFDPTALAADSATAPKQAAQARFGYDLERGTSMAPDAREPKPIY
jgi:hypothetical protein